MVTGFAGALCERVREHVVGMYTFVRSFYIRGILKRGSYVTDTKRATLS